MEPDHVKAYVERTWAIMAALKQEHWAHEFAERGPAATMAASQALWEHMRRHRPDWPSDEERRDDLAHHLTLKRALDRAASALRSVAAR